MLYWEKGIEAKILWKGIELRGMGGGTKIKRTLCTELQPELLRLHYLHFAFSELYCGRCSAKD